MCRHLRPIVAGVSVALCAAASLITVDGQGEAPAPAGAQDTPVLRARTTAVLVDVYPQRDGRIVEGLTAEQFQVYEDGQLQRIDSIEFVRIEPAPPDAPRRDPSNLRAMYTEAADPRTRVFVAFLDEFHTTTNGSNLVRRPLLDLIDSAVGVNDLFGIMTARMRPQDVTFGRQQVVLEEQLARYWTWGQRQRTTSDRPDPMEENLRLCYGDRAGIERRNGQDLDDVLIERRREEQTLTALRDLVQHLGGLREARTVVILISDGWVLFEPNRGLAEEAARRAPGGLTGRTRDPFGGPRTGIATPGTSLYAQCAAEAARLAQIDSPDRLREIISLANRGNVSIYPVATGGLGVFDSSLSAPAGPATDSARVRSRVESLRTIAEETDGLAIVNTNDLDVGMRRVTDDVSAYYLLAYSPTNTKPDGRYRRIEVKVGMPDVSLRARRGYIAPTEAALASAAAEVAAAAGAPGVEAAVEALPVIAPSTELLTYARHANGQLHVVVELASRVAQLAAWRNGGQVTVDVTPDGGTSVSAAGEIPPGARSVLVRVPAAPPGPWRVSVRAVAAGNSLVDQAVVPAESGGLLGTPIAFRATPSPRSPLLPVASFQFHRGERLRIEWPVLRPLDTRRARLLDRRGHELAEALPTTERSVDGEAVLGVDLNLSSFAAGEYVIEVSAAAGADTDRKLIAFRLVR